MSDRFWIARIEDRELRERVRRLMVDLTMLAEGAAASLEPSVSHSKSSGNPPPRTHSLAEKYAQRFQERLQDDAETEATCIKAEAELLAFKGGAEQTDRLKVQRERSEATDIKNLLEHGQGIPAAVISARNEWPIGWVRHIRQRNGQDPDTGYERPRWRELGDEERFGWVQECKSEGMSQREAAMRLGVSHGSVGKYWHEGEAA